LAAQKAGFFLKNPSEISRDDLISGYLSIKENFRRNKKMPLHPKAVEALKAAGEKVPVVSFPVAEIRKIFYNNFVNPGRVLEDVKSVEDSYIPCMWGNMAIRIYRPENVLKKGGMIYYHGGGFSMNCIETHDALCRKLANAVKRTVISVEYRLAPEHKCPAQAEDAVSAAVWVYDNAEKLGIDCRRLALCGDSGGAYLSAIVCQYLRDRNSPVKIEKQILVYPPTDYVFPGTASMIENDKFSVVNRNFTVWAWNKYLKPDTDMGSPYVFQ